MTLNLAKPLVIGSLLASSVAMGATTAWAEGPARVRGTISSLDGNNLVVKSREGSDVAIHLADKWRAVGVVKASIADVKPGAFVGTAAVPSADNVDELESLELVVFPEAMRGLDEGHYPWDLQPNSRMTNATVSSKVESVKGQTLTLSYKGGEKKVTLTPDTPIVTLTSAPQGDVKPGAPVFIIAKAGANGALEASTVLVGENGIAPPM